ncbi:hypothetical protein DL89DRAFT_266475 [Linderina pennispora]|uniref:Xylanolytic transcriptional activator regulatory domain-containing protein n=1 Tax=Linderina pennispora TaxID=61395 RepID=A0A1Y1WDC0_9FUNG|nr:uncharacterized protein DL89DRAFT_266475 [Linderina pennispora]ORX71452.1 hypothetical protein DL89DRAFT_266475 [Linderina pennispora]
MKRRGPKPRKGKPGVVVPSQSAEKKAPSAADISNLLLSDHRVAIVTHLSPKQDALELPETTSAHASTLSFEVSSVGDLLDQFYSDKVCAETREAIITFFDIHYAKLPIFHPSTLIPLSSYNMSGYTIDTEKLVTSVKSRILLCMDEEPSLEVMQAMVVMSLLEIFRERHYSLAALLNATIGLIIQLKWNEIDLYKTKKPETWAEWVEMETKRRVFWAVFQFDNLVSITDGGHSTSIPESVIFVRAPCMDTEWNDIDFADYTPKCRQPAEDTEPTDLVLLTETRTVVSGAIWAPNNCRIVRFLWDAKTGVYDRDKYGLSERPFPAANFLEKLPSKGILAYPIRRKARLISEYPEFQKYSDRLCTFYTQFMDRASEEGCLRNTMYGQFPVRVRYLVLQCFVCASFFAEFDCPPEMQPESMSPDDLRKRLLLKKRFGATWSQSLLANDIEPESWKVCVEYAHKLARFIERNSDLPHTRITYASAQCLFIVSSVLLRQINICKTALGTGRDSQMSLEEWQEELERCVEETRVLWRKLQGFNLIWTTTDMTDMLLSMDIAKATTTTEPVANVLEKFRHAWLTPPRCV